MRREGPMKNILLFSILFCAIALPALGELTAADLDKIRLIVKDEIKKEVTSSETRMKKYIDLKIEGVNGRITGIEGRFTGVDGRFTGLEGQIATLTYLVYALIVLIVIAIGIPQIIMIMRDNLKQQRITNP